MKEQFCPERFWSVRNRSRLTIEDLSDRSGVDHRTIDGLESGTGQPQFAMLVMLARALRVPLGAFYE